VGSLTEPDLEVMRAPTAASVLRSSRATSRPALRANDELPGVPVVVAANRALTAVLDQITPVLRRAEPLRFYSQEGRASLARHDELIRLCAASDAEGAAAIAFDTFHSLPTTEARPKVCAEQGRIRCVREGQFSDMSSAPVPVGMQSSWPRRRYGCSGRRPEEHGETPASPQRSCLAAPVRASARC
jgi:hypothetical protein